MQFESGPVATSYIATAGTAVARGADVITVASPLGTTPRPFCVATKQSANWGSGTLGQWSLGSGPNRITAYVGVAAGPTVVVRDAENAASTASKAGAISSGYSSKGTAFCYTPGAPLRMGVDGVELSGLTFGGTGGALGALQSSLSLGVESVSQNALNGKIARVKICRTADPTRCRL
jgi:hypothetical protein